jgi:hypothetical protein
MDEKIVLTIGCNMSSDNDLFGNLAPAIRDFIKYRLDELHKRKIDLADEVLILNVGGYIGESTRSELEYAREHDKIIRWLESVGAPNIRDPEFPCAGFEPIGTVYGEKSSGNCESDGHYMCNKCVQRKPMEV